MVDQVRAFLELDLKALAKKNQDDFTEIKQKELKKTLQRCANDTEFSLEKPLDTENDNFRYFALCLRNSVSINPALNSSKTIRLNVLGYQY